MSFLHAVSRWQLGASTLDRNPLSPWCGEPAMYELASAGAAPLRLHPSRVVRFLGNPLPDPTHGTTRYLHPRTGRSVTIDDITGQVIQLGGDGFDY